jgi:hypothetical protein
VALLAVAAGCLAAGEEPPTIRMNPGPDGHLERVTFDVDGLPAADLAALAKVTWSRREWSDLLHVSADDRPATAPGPGTAPPLAGAYRVVGRVLRFTPEAPPEDARRYRAVIDPSRLPGRAAASGGTIEALFDPPRTRTR